MNRDIKEWPMTQEGNCDARGNEKIFVRDGIKICTDSFGNPGRPSFLLIDGAMMSMIWWDEEFCLRLAERGFFVIRFDNRDTGRSQTCEPGKAAYSVDDMADDCIRVLDFWETDRAHLLGISLGGMIAQIAAMKYPKRVSSMTCLSSSVWATVDPPLPDMDPRALANSERTKNLDWNDRDAAVNFLVGTGRLLCGGKRTFDEKRHRELAQIEYDRSTDLRALQNYLTLGGGETWWDKEIENKIPVAVIHGTDDIVLPYPHGEAIARRFSGSTLIALDGAGHQPHKDDWETIITSCAEIAGKNPEKSVQ
jgi:pimeloyl-ACP methyl ester carboxylesterase